MSLVNFISAKGCQELRDKFKAAFPKPKIKLTGELLAPPPLTTTNRSVVGQAFDYLLRFKLEHLHKEKINSKGSWIANASYSTIIHELKNSSVKVVRIGRLGDIEKNRKNFARMLQDEYSLAEKNHFTYLSNGIATDSLIKSSLYLARLDIHARAGFIDANLGNESELDIQDVRQVLSLVNAEHFKVQNHCFVNPTFGVLGIGADGDLIIDDTLIEIKVIKNLEVERRHLNQLIGYYIFSLIGGVNGEKNCKPIKNIGIYFARHGILWKYPITEIANEETIIEFKNWFCKYINDKIWGGQLIKELSEQAAKAATKKPVKKVTKREKRRLPERNQQSND